MRNTLRLLVLALVVGPAFSPADKKTDDNLLQIQRDIASLDDDVKNLQKAQKSEDDKLEALRLLVQQAVTASTQVSQDMAALQRTLTASVTTALNDQQSKISLAVAPLGSQMDSLSQGVNAATQTIGQMNIRIGSLDTRIKDLSDKVSILNQPPAQPPPAPTAAVPGAANAPATPDANVAPPGTTRLGLWQGAESDYASAHDEQAVKEYSEFIKYYKDDEYAPTAGYRIGQVFARQKDYDGAVQAFQDVIDHYPGNNRAQDALYQKAMALEAGGHKKDAIAAFNEFLMSYPANDYAPQAKRELAKLTASAGKQPNKGRGAK
jgi:TolA-binding protein